MLNIDFFFNFNVIKDASSNTYNDFNLCNLSKWSTCSSMMGLYDIFLQKKGENKQQWTAHTHKWLMKLQFTVHYAWEDGNKAQQSSVMQFHENKQNTSDI